MSLGTKWTVNKQYSLPFQRIVVNVGNVVDTHITTDSPQSHKYLRLTCLSIRNFKSIVGVVTVCDESDP